MKRTFFYLLIALFASSNFATAQHKVEINGHVKFVEPDFKITLYQPDGSNRKVFAETTVDADQNYKLNIDVEKAGMYFLDCAKWQMVPVWIEDENLEIDFRGLDTARVKIKNPPYVHIKGGENNDLMNLVNFKNYRNYQNLIGISQTIYKAKPALGDSAYNALLIAQYNLNNADSKAYNRFLAESYADRKSVLAVIQQLNPTTDADVIEPAIKKLLAKYPNYQPVVDYQNKVIADREQKKRLELGQKAPAFSYTGYKEKKKYGPESFKGKLLLIDFWASWCGPCRKEIPNLKKIYDEFKGQGVEFLSVSIDKSSTDWEKAVIAEKMAWKQVIAPDAGSQVMNDYQFNGIPFIVLLDEEGRFYCKKYPRRKDKGRDSEVYQLKKNNLSHFNFREH